jgi:cysteine desulfurase / selenocysteine lyase
MRDPPPCGPAAARQATAPDPDTQSSNALSSRVDWEAVRLDYPGALTKTYLDTACKGIPPTCAIEAIEAFCRDVRECAGRSATEDTLRYLQHLDDARLEAARMIGADPSEIALVESTQHGINAVAQALNLQPGDIVVTCDIEFLATIVPWRYLERQGVKVCGVPHRAGRIDVADIEAAIDHRTRIVSVSASQDVTGATVELNELAEICQARNVILLVDGTQHLGPATIDVRRVPIDVLAVGGSKWLLNPFGLGFLYVRRDLLSRLRPPVAGYMALLPPEGGWAEHLLNATSTVTGEMRFVNDGRKLETGGTGPYLAAASLAASLSRLRDLGLEAIEARVREMTLSLIEGLDGLGLETITPREDSRRAGIVTFTTGEMRRDTELHTRLLNAGVVTSQRYRLGLGGLRVALYVYSNANDVDRLLDVSRSFCKGVPSL